MPIVTSKALLADARENQYAVGAFNVFNMESAKAVIAAAEQEKSPVLLQVWSGLDAFVGLDVLAAIVRCEAAKASVPVVLHLDHGMNVEQIVKAIQHRFTSVMIDGSSLPLADNIAMTRSVVAIAHAAGLPVEGEIGHVGGEEGAEEASDDIVETDLEEAVKFYERTGVDTLAVSIGTSHGQYKQAPKLNIDLLRQVAARIPIPLVLHGSSYTPEEMIREAIKHGIAKINVDTELRNTVIATMTQQIKQGLEAQFVSQLTSGGYERMTEKVREKMRLFGSSGRA